MSRMTINIKTSISLINPIAVIFKSLANVIAKVVGADLDNITPTPILAAFNNISDEIRPLNISTLFLTEYVFQDKTHIAYRGAL